MKNPLKLQYLAKRYLVYEISADIPTVPKYLFAAIHQLSWPSIEVPSLSPYHCPITVIAQRKINLQHNFRSRSLNKTNFFIIIGTNRKFRGLMIFRRIQGRRSDAPFVRDRPSDKKLNKKVTIN